MKTLLAIAAGLLAVMLVRSSLAAEPARVEIISVDEQVGRLNVVISAYGPDGRPVSNLSAGMLRAALDGQVLTITNVQAVSLTRTPVAVLLLVDTSGSMAGDPINQARRAMLEFVGQLDPGDQVSVVAFDSTVRPLQGFTSNRTLIAQAINRLQAVGDTALYEAVIEAARRASESNATQRLVVLLSDGLATVGREQRAASLDAAARAKIPFVSIGLGNGADRQYLGELAAASGGRFLEAPNPAALRSSYVDLAQAIKSKYTVSLAVPESIDRSLEANLTIRLGIGANVATAERSIPPRPGAVPFPLTFQIDGLPTGQKLSSPARLLPVVPSGVTPVTVEYFVDGQPVFRAEQPPFGLELDPAAFAVGNHVLKAILTDPRGRTGEWQGVFGVPAPPKGERTPGLPLTVAIVAATGTLAALAFVLSRRRRRLPAEQYVTRIKPWHGRVAETQSPRPEVQEAQRRPPQGTPDQPRLLGRVVVMHEEAIRGGDLNAIREYDIGIAPISIGASPSCDIVLADAEGRVVGEEARVWVQRGHLVYHKLTTLSAMATEGVTSGWHFLKDGEHVNVGPYRIVFTAVPADEGHAVGLQPLSENPKIRELWPRFPEEPERFATQPDY